MRIGEAARAAGVSTSAMRFYERLGLLPQPDRTPSGYRDYSDEVVSRLAFIQASQGIGLTLAEVNDILKYREMGEAPCIHVVELLERREREVTDRIRELRQLRSELRRLLSRGRELDPAACQPQDVCHIVPRGEQSSS